MWSWSTNATDRWTDRQTDTQESTVHAPKQSKYKNLIKYFGRLDNFNTAIQTILQHSIFLLTKKNIVTKFNNMLNMAGSKRFLKSSYHHHVIYHRPWIAELKVETDKTKLKVEMQPVSDHSDDDNIIWKRLLVKPCFELAAKGVLRMGRCCILWQGVPGIWASNREIVAPCMTADSIERVT